MPRGRATLAEQRVVLLKGNGACEARDPQKPSATWAARHPSTAGDMHSAHAPGHCCFGCPKALNQPLRSSRWVNFSGIPPGPKTCSQPLGEGLVSGGHPVHPRRAGEYPPNPPEIRCPSAPPRLTHMAQQPARTAVLPTLKNKATESDVTLGIIRVQVNQSCASAGGGCARTLLKATPSEHGAPQTCKSKALLPMSLQI